MPLSVALGWCRPWTWSLVGQNGTFPSLSVFCDRYISRMELVVPRTHTPREANGWYYLLHVLVLLYCTIDSKTCVLAYPAPAPGRAAPQPLCACGHIVIKTPRSLVVVRSSSPRADRCAQVQLVSCTARTDSDTVP